MNTGILNADAVTTATAGERDVLLTPPLEYYCRTATGVRKSVLISWPFCRRNPSFTRLALRSGRNIARLDYLPWELVQQVALR